MENFTITKETVEMLKRKGKLIGDIAVSSVMKEIANETTVKMGVGVGLLQGLKYNGNLKRGVKAGLTTVGVVAGMNAVMNIASNWDNIKKH